MRRHMFTILQRNRSSSFKFIVDGTIRTGNQVAHNKLQVSTQSPNIWCKDHELERWRKRQRDGQMKKMEKTIQSAG